MWQWGGEKKEEKPVEGTGPSGTTKRKGEKKGGCVKGVGNLLLFFPCCEGRRGEKKEGTHRPLQLMGNRKKGEKKRKRKMRIGKGNDKKKLDGKEEKKKKKESWFDISCRLQRQEGAQKPKSEKNRSTCPSLIRGKKKEKKKEDSSAV